MRAHVAHHFDDAQQQFDSAQLGMWVFLVTEVMFFGGLFAGYTAYRFSYPGAFSLGSERLDLILGTANTAVLLTSSLTMALAVYAAQTGHRKGTVLFLLLTIGLGTFFLSIKAHEYAEKYRHHEVPGRTFSFQPAAMAPNVTSHAAPDPASDPVNIVPGEVELFFSFYFAMTGLHALHIIVGLFLLGSVAWLAWRGQFSSAYYTPVEMVGLYWHFVDIIWVFLFPLLYLIR